MQNHFVVLSFAESASADYFKNAFGSIADFAKLLVLTPNFWHIYFSPTYLN